MFSLCSSVKHLLPLILVLLECISNYTSLFNLWILVCLFPSYEPFPSKKPYEPFISKGWCTIILTKIITYDFDLAHACPPLKSFTLWSPTTAACFQQMPKYSSKIYFFKYGHSILYCLVLCKFRSFYLILWCLLWWCYYYMHWHKMNHNLILFILQVFSLWKGFWSIVKDGRLLWTWVEHQGSGQS